jgi:hypothetical protein
MNIQTVATNLRNTIAGKEEMLTMLNSRRVVDNVAIKFLTINIDELRRILQDVESCVAKDVEQSWRDNPDRSGGQFTQDEIDNANRW